MRVKNVLLRIFSVALVTALSVVVFSSHASAASILVTTADEASAVDGDCSLREAITAANTNAIVNECSAGAAGSDTINFNITTGGTTFTNQAQTGYTISLATELPSISEQVVINGYTQPGSDDNNTVAPLPFDAIILVQIDGSGLNSGDRGLYFTGGASGSAASEVRGLVLNGFENGNAISINANSIVIQGNYIGTTPDGSAAATTAQANQVAITNDNVNPDPNSNVLIGGLDANDRNILSGQTGAAGYPVDGWVIQGNYIGIAADGTTAVPNSTATTPGSLSIDDCTGVLVGGTAAGATNVISGNNSYGLAPENALNVTVQGNLIGTDYTGQVAVPNNVGIIVGGTMTGSLFGGTTAAARNIISGNAIAGFVSGTTGGFRVEGNYIGLDIQGDDPLPNPAGIIIGDDGVVVGGSALARNAVAGNTYFNVGIQRIDENIVSENNEISYNYIGTNAAGNTDPAITAAQGEGVRISAGATGNMVQNNLITGNRDSGVAIRSFTATNIGFTLTPAHNAILGNSIYGNSSGGPIATQTTQTLGLGIDIYTATVDVLAFPIDFVADSYSALGVTPNDPSDPDTGPNNSMNFPVINNATQNGTALTVNFDLDAADSTDGNYRVEFFVNDAADASGYGEGQTYLGSTTVANGAAQEAVLTLANGSDLTGKSITATTTAINNTTTSGFGATSEFSQVRSITVLPQAALAETGDNTLAYVLGLMGLLGVGLGLRRSLAR